MTAAGFLAARPVVTDWSAPHQQVKATTIPWSVFVIDETWLGKINWRLSQDVQWWSNMMTSLSRTINRCTTMIRQRKA